MVCTVLDSIILVNILSFEYLISSSVKKFSHLWIKVYNFFLLKFLRNNILEVLGVMDVYVYVYCENFIEGIGKLIYDCYDFLSLQSGPW